MAEELDFKILKSNDELVVYDVSTGEISITWDGETITHTAKDWLNANMGNELLKRDIDRHMNIGEKDDTPH